MKKTLNILGAIVGVILIAVVVVYSRVPAKETNAQASAPAISIAFDQGAPGTTQQSGQTSVSNAQLTISSGGPFTEDFQIQICITSVNSPYQFCGTTPWASQSYGSTVWSPWVWPGYNNGLNATSPGLITLTVNTRPLPQGTTLSNVALGLGIAEANGGPGTINPNAANVTPCDYGYTPAGGGSTPNVFGYPFGDCTRGASLTPDDIQIGIKATTNQTTDAAGVPPYNIPTSFNPSQTVTVGTDGNPLEITVQNTGGSTWTSDQSTVISGSAQGTCDGYAGTQPSANDPQGSSCTFSIDNSSDIYKLKHVSGGFNVGNDPVQYHQIVSETCTVGSSNCDDSSCSGDENACTTSGYCSDGRSDEVDCEMNGYQWINGCNSVWEPQVSCSNTNENVAPGGTANFLIGSLTAPSNPGNTNEVWQMENNGTPFGQQITIPITVSGAPTSTNPTDDTGTITVMSENSVTQDPVNATWDMYATPSLTYLTGTDPCLDGIACEGTAQNYSGQPAIDNNGTPGVTYTFIPTAPANPNLYSFDSIQRGSAAEKKMGVMESILSLTKNIFGSTAEAYDIPPNNPVVGTLLPDATLPFVVLWNPIAGIAVSSTQLQVSATPSTSGTGQVQIVNTGTPGSTLTWTSTSDASWLTVSPSADSSGVTNDDSGNDASENVTINAASLPLGNYTGHITFVGASSPGTIPSGSMNAMLTVNYSVTATAVTSTVSSVRILSCSPTSVNTGITSTCTATVSGTGGYDGSVTWGSDIGTIVSTGSDIASFSSSVPGTANITACSNEPGYTNVCDTTQVTVTAPTPPACTPGVTCPVCANPIISANPSSIVIPEASQLSYSCRNVNYCTLTGSDGSSYPINWVGATTASGTQSVEPTMTTVYTFACSNTNYSSSSASVSLPVQVTVGGTSRCEQNPNGAGCQ